MAITLHRNSKESAERFISRFNKKVQASRVLLLLRERRYYKRKPNKRYMRAAAIMRDFHRLQREKQRYH